MVRELRRTWGGGDIIDLTNINPKLEGRRSWKRCVIMADVCPEYEAIIYFILFYFTLHFFFFLFLLYFFCFSHLSLTLNSPGGGLGMDTIG